MKSYQVMIEGVFVYAPELIGEIGGFHATFFLRASDAKKAVSLVRRMLLERIKSHNVVEIEQGSLSSYYLVRDIWEISDDRLSKYHEKDHGFTFFRIGGIERIRLYIKKVFLKRFKPWIFVGGSR